MASERVSSRRRLVPSALKEAYVEGRVALGLGAGVSQASSLPGWNELVCRVAESTPKFDRASAQALLKEGYDATVVATILRSHLASDTAFGNAVREALYKDFPFHEPVGKSNHRRFAVHIRQTNPTLHAIGTLCAIAQSHDLYRPNPKVRAVMTLNIDALLEMYTRARFKKRVLRTVERASASASVSRIHAYHVHGYLVRDFQSSAKASRATEADDRLVLTEQHYFDVVASANGFVNYTMLYLLREHRFLFVGLSMKDPNLRRALHLSFQERMREVLAEGADEAAARTRATRHWAVMRREGPELDAATAILLNVIGVSPVWIRAWADIPVLLRDLYEAGGDIWDAAA